MALAAIAVPNSPGLFKLKSIPVTSVPTIHGQATLQTFDEPALVKSVNSIP